MDVQGSAVLRDCIAQLCYANGALRSRDTARMRSNAPEMYPIPVRRESATMSWRTRHAAISFPFRLPLTTRSRSRFAIRRNFITRRGRMRGVVDRGNGPGLHFAENISFMQHVGRRRSKIRGREENPDGVSCWRAENLGVSCKGFAWFTRTVLAARVSTHHVYM